MYNGSDNGTKGTSSNDFDLTSAAGRSTDGGEKTYNWCGDSHGARRGGERGDGRDDNSGGRSEDR